MASNLWNIDWEATAAVVQALGSVAAIFIAIAIDRGATRRLESQRLAEARAIRNVKVQSMMRCQIAMSNAATAIKALDPSGGTVMSMPYANRRELEASATALKYFLAQDGETDGNLVVAMADTDTIIGNQLAMVRQSVNIATAVDQNAWVETFKLNSGRVEEIIEEYRHARQTH